MSISDVEYGHPLELPDGLIDLPRLQFAPIQSTDLADDGVPSPSPYAFVAPLATRDYSAYTSFSWPCLPLPAVSVPATPHTVSNTIASPDSPFLSLPSSFLWPKLPSNALPPLKKYNFSEASDSKVVKTKRQTLSCFFCRERKIACARPEGETEGPCNQCTRRKRTCTYPTASRRGQHMRKSAGVGSAVPSDQFTPAPESQTHREDQVREPVDEGQPNFQDHEAPGGGHANRAKGGAKYQNGQDHYRG